MVGYGSTEISYDNLADTSTVETRIISPQGRIHTNISHGDVFTDVWVSLLWDWNDMGEYLVETSHSRYCRSYYSFYIPQPTFVWDGVPFTPNTPCYGSGGIFRRRTFLTRIVGYSRLCYRYDHYDPYYLNPYVYRILEGCEARVSCADTYFYSVYNAGMRARSQQGWYRIPGTSFNICTRIRVPLQSGACDTSYCEDSQIF